MRNVVKRVFISLFTIVLVFILIIKLDVISYNNWLHIIGIAARCTPYAKSYYGVKPNDYEYSTWKSYNPDIVFSVYEDSYHRKGYLVNNNEKVSVEFYFFATDIIVLDKAKSESASEEKLMFQGECDYYRTKCKIKVTQSNLDKIEVGDMIVLERQD